MNNIKMIVLFALVSINSVFSVTGGKDGDSPAKGSDSTTDVATHGSAASDGGEPIATALGGTTSGAASAAPVSVVTMGGDDSPDGRPHVSAEAGAGVGSGAGPAPLRELTPSQLKSRVFKVGGCAIVVGAGVFLIKKVLDYLRQKEEQEFLKELFDNNSIVAQDQMSSTVEDQLTV